jgi:hypothetical protein
VPLAAALLKVPPENQAQFRVRAERASERARASGASSTEIELAIWVLCALCGGASEHARSSGGGS